VHAQSCPDEQGPGPHAQADVFAIERAAHWQGEYGGDERDLAGFHVLKHVVVERKSHHGAEHAQVLVEHSFPFIVILDFVKDEYVIRH
jgi:hypothetical protein